MKIKGKMLLEMIGITTIETTMTTNKALTNHRKIGTRLWKLKIISTSIIPTKKITMGLKSITNKQKITLILRISNLKKDKQKLSNKKTLTNLNSFLDSQAKPTLTLSI